MSLISFELPSLSGLPNNSVKYSDFLFFFRSISNNASLDVESPIQLLPESFYVFSLSHAALAVAVYHRVNLPVWMVVGSRIVYTAREADLLNFFCHERLPIRCRVPRPIQAHLEHADPF